MTHSILKPQFDYAALEPFIDQGTMELHVEKHHQGYADKLNAALTNHPELAETNLPELLTVTDRSILNPAGGVWNHNFFWTILSSQHDQPIPQPLETKLVEVFTSIDEFKKQFTTAATSLFGSGWTWLVKVDHTLKIINLPNQDNPFTTGLTPLLALDLWEHAYYLKYQNRRAEYIDGFWHIINWQEVNTIYSNL